MLHVTNGDSTAGELRKAGLDGQVMPWLEILHEGPVPETGTEEELIEVRAEFLATWSEQSLAVVKGDYARQVATVRDAGQVTLWFEHDLYDQLSMLQVLCLLAGGRAAVDVICVDAFPGREVFRGLGELGHEQLATLWPSRRRFGPGDLHRAQLAWSAFRNPDPTGVAAMAAETVPELPFLASAFRRHLQEFPATGDGLSRSERLLLEGLQAEPQAFVDLYRGYRDRDHPHGFADRTILSRLQTMSRGPEALVRRLDPDDALPAKRARWGLTDSGRRALGGRLDRAAALPLDRWLGGVHVTGPDPQWRWNPATAQLAAA